jgi:LysM repeat protein
MSPESTNTPSTKLCPTCGTRVSSDATRCLVCGAELANGEKPAAASKALQGSRMPEITLSLPAAIGMLALFLGIGAILVYFALRTQPEMIIESTSTATATITLTPTPTDTIPPPTLTYTSEPSPTPQTYLVKEGDTCTGIALFFGVSVQSIVALNNLPVECNTLSVNQPLLIPQATPTITPLPSATAGAAQQTEDACQQVEYTVQENDTLAGIAAAYNVPMASIKDFNALAGDRVLLGQTLRIPLCMQFATPGPTPTATPPPPYPAPNLLLPADATIFKAGDAITLQWASVGTLREDELYMVTILDGTEGQNRKSVDYVPDTKYVLPTTLRPPDNSVHIYYWWVTVVRQSGTDADGNPTWTSAGADSLRRTFGWTGGGSVTEPTPTP